MASQIVSVAESAHKFATAATQGTNTAAVDNGYVRQNWTVQVHYNGTPTAPSLQLQGSLNGGAQWFNMGSPYTATTDGAIVVANTPAQQVRVAVTGTTVSTDLWLGAV